MCMSETACDFESLYTEISELNKVYHLEIFHRVPYQYFHGSSFYEVSSMGDSCFVRNTKEHVE